MISRLQVLLGGLLVVLFLISNTLFIVRETERAVMLRFGELIRDDVAPGLHFKTPFVHGVRKFDGRLLILDSRPERFLTQEKKFLEVDSYATWRISDVALYYKATNGEELRAQELLSQRINNGLRNQFGERSMVDVVSGERDELITDLLLRLKQQVHVELGVNLVAVRIKRIDLPDDVSDSVYRRMRAEREREAREHRSKGRELAEGIRAVADREKIVITAEAYRESEKVRGQGDAKAATIYADAYAQDREFYAFTRSLIAYRKSFSDSGDLFLISPDSDFFRYLNQASGQPSR